MAEIKGPRACRHSVLTSHEMRRNIGRLAPAREHRTDMGGIDGASKPRDSANR